MAEIITCPSCTRKLQVPESYYGQTVQCPECAHRFAAEAPVPSAPLPAPMPPDPPPEERPRSRRRDYNDVLDDDFDDSLPLRRSGIPHRGGLILTLGIISLVGGLSFLLPFILGPIAWIMGNHDITEIRARRMDPSGEGMIHAGRVLGIISTVLMLMSFAFFCLMFVVIIARVR